MVGTGTFPPPGPSPLSSGGPTQVPPGAGVWARLAQGMHLAWASILAPDPGGNAAVGAPPCTASRVVMAPTPQPSPGAPALAPAQTPKHHCLGTNKESCSGHRCLSFSPFPLPQPCPDMGTCPVRGTGATLLPCPSPCPPRVNHSVSCGQQTLLLGDLVRVLVGGEGNWGWSRVLGLPAFVTDSSWELGVRR